MYRVLYIPTGEYVEWFITTPGDPLGGRSINFRTYEDAAKILLMKAAPYFSFYNLLCQYQPSGYTVHIPIDTLYQAIVPYNDYEIIKVEDV